MYGQLLVGARVLCGWNKFIRQWKRGRDNYCIIFFHSLIWCLCASEKKSFFFAWFVRSYAILLEFQCYGESELNELIEEKKKKKTHTQKHNITNGCIKWSISMCLYIFSAFDKVTHRHLYWDIPINQPVFYLEFTTTKNNLQLRISCACMCVQ